MIEHRPARPPGLLVLPGWDDDGRMQYELLTAELSARGWLCRRGDLPDASWDPDDRDSVSREDTLRQTFRDFDALAADADPASIAVLGFSYGAYMAVLLAAERHVEWMLLRAPALYPDAHWRTPKSSLDKERIARYRAHERSPSSNRALAACRKFRGDVLLIEDEKDEVIPEPVVDSFEDALTSARSRERVVLPGADHELSLEASRVQYHRIVVEWLSKRLAANPQQPRSTATKT